MKKIMISLLMIAATLNAMAITYTGKVQVVLRATSNNAACAAVIATSDALNDGLNPTYYAELNDEGKEVLAYVEYNSVRYEHFGSSATTMRNMPLIMKANASGEYRMNFYEMEGTIEIYDKVAGANIDKSQPYIFTIEDAQKNTIIANRFVINYTYVTMSGDFDNVGGSWAYLPTPFTHNGATASKELTLDADTWYSFQIDVNGAIGADDYDFDSDYKSHVVPTTGWIEKLSLHTDIAGVYTFTWEYATNTLTITFPAVAPATGYTVTPNAAGYATFSAAEATVIPTGATAYTGTISGEELILNQIMGGYVPANTGVIVAGVDGTPYNFAIYDGSVAAIADNALKATATYNTSMKNVYVLKGNAFLEYVGTNALAANKAYIQLPEAGPNNAPKRIRMVINGATDVENVQGDNVQCTKVIENGQIYILHNGAKYNVQGQIVQ